MDTRRAVDASNPLRQVIINTHSPAVVQQVPEGSLLLAELRRWMDRSGAPGEQLALAALGGTWRDSPEPGVRTITKGALLAYLLPEKPRDGTEQVSDQRRVIDRLDMGQLLLSLG